MNRAHAIARAAYLAEALGLIVYAWCATPPGGDPTNWRVGSCLPVWTCDWESFAPRGLRHWEAGSMV